MQDDAATVATTAVTRRFHDAFDRHDAEAFVALVADDCVIENSGPAPEGSRHLGKAACLAVWQGLAVAEGTWFTREEVWVVGERVVVRWRYHWGEGAEPRPTVQLFTPIYPRAEDRRC